MFSTLSTCVRQFQNVFDSLNMCYVTIVVVLPYLNKIFVMCMYVCIRLDRFFTLGWNKLTHFTFNCFFFDFLRISFCYLCMSEIDISKKKVGRKKPFFEKNLNISETVGPIEKILPLWFPLYLRGLLVVTDWHYQKVGRPKGKKN